MVVAGVALRQPFTSSHRGRWSQLLEVVVAVHPSRVAAMLVHLVAAALLVMARPRAWLQIMRAVARKLSRVLQGSPGRAAQQILRMQRAAGHLGARVRVERVGRVLRPARH